MVNDICDKLYRIIHIRFENCVASGKTLPMDMPKDRVIHCHACSKYVKLADEVVEGDVVECPFCHSKNQVRVMAVFVGHPVEEA